ncbi:hypothetical protein ACWD01_35735 [Streptomyces sp. NPDC002835]
MGTAVDRFRDEFRHLHEAAGKPTLQSMVRFGAELTRPARVSESSISEWLNGKTVPTKDSSRRFFLELTVMLAAKARAKSGYQPPQPLYWKQLLDNARRERAGQQGGRPKGPGYRATEPDVVRAVALRSYLAWLADVTARIPVRGLRQTRGLTEAALDQVYVALKVDSSSPRERAAAAEAVRRDVARLIVELALPPEEEERRFWHLFGDLPVADYFGTPDWLDHNKVEPPTVLTIDQLYRRESVAVILGDPGSGKTTIMRWLALVHARALTEGAAEVRMAPGLVDITAAAGGPDVVLGPPQLPVLVRIGEYAQNRRDREATGLPPLTVAEFIGRHTWDGQRPVWSQDVGEYRAKERIPDDVLTGLLHDALHRGEALVVLDGLDEVAAESRLDTATAVGEFVTTWADASPNAPLGNRIFVTSRIAGYQLAPLSGHLTQVTVERMTDEALTVFVHNWMSEIVTAVDVQGALGGDAAELAGTLTALLLDPANRHVRDLASNPLLASVVVSVFLNREGSLPPQRVEIYQEAVDSLVEVWFRRRNGAGTGLAYQTMVAALPAVAAHIHATKPNGVVSRWEFRSALFDEMARIDGKEPGRLDPALSETVDSLLESMRTEVGLLVESGPESFRFSHQTFQEFFAARHLVSEPAHSARRIRGRLADPRWREPILMALALVNWEHKRTLVGLAESLLAMDGPLAEFFPESALLLAAAVPQMTDVPPEAVRLVTGRLLAGYGAGAGRRGLPRARQLIEEAVSTLRERGYSAEVDRVLATTLVEPGKGGAAAACATAELIRETGAAAPDLAEALIEAEPEWDLPELGHPVTEALVRLVSPPVVGGDGARGAGGARGGHLPQDWRSGRLKMRDLLRRSPDLVERVRTDARWQALILCLYGGQTDLRSADALNEYHRMANYLQLEDSPRAEFTSYYSERWGESDPIYSMAVYLDTGDHKRRWSAPPRFSADAVCRDSPLTMWVTDALRHDDLPGLTDVFRAQLSATDPATAADAALGLWALGEDMTDFLAAGSAASGIAVRRISALSVQLRDATVRSAGLAESALSAASERLLAAEWEGLRASVTGTLTDAGATPVSFSDPGGLPAQLQVHILADEFTQALSGSGDDSHLKAVRFGNSVHARKYAVRCLVDALNIRSTTQLSGYRLYRNWWPADPLAFPCRDGSDIPVTVLDQVLRVPVDLPFAPLWFFQNVFAPLVESNPHLLAETVTVTWSTMHRRKGDGTRIAGLMDDFLDSTDPVGSLRKLARQVADPWYRARALLRLAQVFPADRQTLLAEAAVPAAEVSDPSRLFQLHERFAALTPPARRLPHLDICRQSAHAIDDSPIAVRALLRLARYIPAPDCDEPALEAIDRARDIEDVAERAHILRLALDEYGDRPLIRARMDELLSAVDMGGHDPSAAAELPVHRHLSTLTGDDSDAIQAWVPVALYARSAQQRRGDRTDELTQAWALLADRPSTESVSAILDLHGVGMISCTAAVARAVTAAAEAGAGAHLDPVLYRLTRLDCAAEPMVSAWLTHSRPRIRQVAALLLAEYRRLDQELVGHLSGLLSDDDDLLRGRARHCLNIRTETDSAHDTVTRLGPRTVEQLAALAREHRWSEPSVTLVVHWHLNGLLHDNPTAFSAWCDSVESGRKPGVATAQRIIEHTHMVNDAVWPVLLERLEAGTPDLQAAILRACATMLRHDPTEGTADELQIGHERWAGLHRTIARVQADPLRDHRVLLCSPETVMAAARTALAATDGVLDGESVRRASDALWAAEGTDLGVIITEGEPEDRRGLLKRMGDLAFSRPDEHARCAAAFREVSTRDGEHHWPWVELLTRWTDTLLSTSVHDEPYRWERYEVLAVTAAAAEINRADFRRVADTDILSQRLADATMYFNGFPGREAAARLLGVLRYGSRPVLRALEHALRDVAQVRSGAQRAIAALRNIEETLVDDLAATLTGPSTIAAWSAAQLLAAIGQKADIPDTLRARIIDLLATAARDPRSRRTVHFSYVSAPIPDLPALDDVLTEALRRVYRLG